MPGLGASELKLPLEVGQGHFDRAHGHPRTCVYAPPSVPTLPRADSRGILQKLLPNENRTRNGSVGWLTRPNPGAAVGAIW